MRNGRPKLRQLTLTARTWTTQGLKQEMSEAKLPQKGCDNTTDSPQRKQTQVEEGLWEVVSVHGAIQWPSKRTPHSVETLVKAEGP